MSVDFVVSVGVPVVLPVKVCVPVDVVVRSRGSAPVGGRRRGAVGAVDIPAPIDETLGPAAVLRRSGILVRLLRRLVAVRNQEGRACARRRAAPVAAEMMVGPSSSVDVVELAGDEGDVGGAGV